MSQDNLAKFTTYGPNRGLTLAIGAYQFIDGVCTMPAQDAHAAASILCRYHDVCYAHELEEKSAEYDAAFPNQPATPPAPLTSDSNEIKLPPEGSEIVLVPTPLSLLAKTAPAAEGDNSATSPEQEGEAGNQTAPAGESAENNAPDTGNAGPNAAPDDKPKETPGKEAPAKTPTPKKPNSK